LNTPTPSHTRIHNHFHTTVHSTPLSAAAELADLTLDIHVDGATASKVRDLARLKEAAVAAEEYDEAKRLKAAIERLKVGLGGFCDVKWWRVVRLSG
jgi:hypothetical protein